MRPDPILEAITGHREAWDTFQIAPEGEDTILANGALFEALDALLAASCATRAGAYALLAHLHWWLVEEAEFAGDYQPVYGRAEARVAELAMLLGAPASGSDAADPIFAVLDAANTAEGAHVLACETLDEAEDASMRGCNAACERASLARREVMRTLPATIGGLRALTCHYVRWGEAWAEDGFLHIARSLAGCEPRLGLNLGSGR